MAGEWRGGRAPGPVWPDGLPVPVRLAGGSGPHPPSVYSSSNSMPGAEATCEGVTGRGERIHGTKGGAGRHGRPDTRVNQQTSVQRRGRPWCERQSRRTLGNSELSRGSTTKEPPKWSRPRRWRQTAPCSDPLVRQLLQPPNHLERGHPLCRENSPCWPTTQDGDRRGWLTTQDADHPGRVTVGAAPAQGQLQVLRLLSTLPSQVLSLMPKCPSAHL